MKCKHLEDKDIPISYKLFDHEWLHLCGDCDIAMREQVNFWDIASFFSELRTGLDEKYTKPPFDELMMVLFNRMVELRDMEVTDGKEKAEDI